MPPLRAGLVQATNDNTFMVPLGVQELASQVLPPHILHLGKLEKLQTATADSIDDGVHYFGVSAD